MNITTRLKGLGAMALLSVASLHAQDAGFGVDLKLRTSYASETKDKLNNSAFGLGLNLHNTFSWGTLNAEIGYFYNAGRQYRADLLSPGAGAPAADPTISVDSRKNSLEQLNLRLSYEREFVKDWSWQAGFTIGNSKFRQEYIADVADPGFTTYEDTYNGTPTKSKISVSPFAGVSYRINPDSSFELNLISVSYTAIDFQHHPGSAIVGGSTTRPGDHLLYQGDSYAESKRNTLRLELGYAFRF